MVESIIHYKHSRNAYRKLVMNCAAYGKECQITKMKLKND